MQIDLILLYNLFGTVICLLAIIMFAIPYRKDKDGIKFNAAKIYLAVMFMLTGASMFAAQCGKQLQHNSFEKLDIYMLFFFFLISQGFLISFLILYTPQHANKTICKRTILPILLLFGIYFSIILYEGDTNIYSAEEFLSRLPQEPLLMLRCVILVAVVSSIINNIVVCHRAKKEYHTLIINNFSETDFSRSVWLSNLLGCGEALSVWVLLTYFYTTPVIEALVGVLITAVFTFYVKAFYEYQAQFERFRSVILFSEQSAINIEIPMTTVSEREEEDRICEALLEEWKNRDDKPFTKVGLTIADVARDLAIPRHHISNYINQGQNNFYSWVNELRIQEASRLLIENETLSITDIATQTGFCDLSAFSRSFKKVKKISPSEFRHQIRATLVSAPQPTSTH